LVWGGGTAGTIPTERVHNDGLHLVLTGILGGDRFDSSDETPLLPSLQPALVTTVPAITGTRISAGIRQLTLELSADFPRASAPRSYRWYSAAHTAMMSTMVFLITVELAVGVASGDVNAASIGGVSEQCVCF